MGPSRRFVGAFVLTAGLALSAACWFERRPEPLNGEEDPTALGDAALALPDGGARDSVRAVIRAYHEALRVGDGGRVASLSVLGATLLDQEEGVAWRLGAGGADRLPGPLTRGATGLGWERTGTDFLARDGLALVVDRYSATVEGEEVPWTAVETLLLERTPDGWRIRHVHRSRGRMPDAGPPGSPDEEPT